MQRNKRQLRRLLVSWPFGIAVSAIVMMSYYAIRSISNDSFSGQWMWQIAFLAIIINSFVGGVLWLITSLFREKTVKPALGMILTSIFATWFLITIALL